MTLHIINKSPYQHQSLQDCLDVCTKGDDILLIEDGVYAATANTDHCARLEACGLDVYALTPDIEARGLTERLNHPVRPISDAEFVELTVKHSAILSWY